MEKHYTNDELLEASKELINRYPDTYDDKDGSFAYWVSECQKYLEWKRNNDWGVIKK